MQPDPATAGDMLLVAEGIVKTFGAVRALRDASLAVRPGEVHALLGANGAGKSTLVKILTGALHPDSGVITIRGQQRQVHDPAQARRTGLVPVYQEPALLPDLEVLDNLRLSETPVEPFVERMHALGIGDVDLARDGRRSPARSAAHHGPRARDGDHAGRAAAGRDDRGPAR